MPLKFTQNRVVAGALSFASNPAVRLISVLVGETGEAGDSAGFIQAYSDTTSDADPGAGTFRLNNATIASATAAYLDNLDASGGTVSSLIDRWDDSTTTIRGAVRFVKVGTPGVWAEFQVTGSVVNATGYRRVTLSGGVSIGTFTATDQFSITFSRTGDAGAGFGDMVAANNLSDVSSKATAATNLGLGAIGNFLNLALSASAGSSALTIALKGTDGNDPSSSNPIVIGFRDAALTSGDYTPITVSAATSLVISSGSKLGTSDNTPFRVWIVGFNDAGTFRLGAIVCTVNGAQHPIAEWAIASSTAEGGAGAADSAGVFYTGSAVSSKALRILGFMTWESGLATAGTWSAAPTVVQLFGQGVPLPGAIIQSRQTTDTAFYQAAVDTFTATSVTATLTPKSAANPVQVTFVTGLNSGGGGVAFCHVGVTRGGSLIGVTQTNVSIGSGTGVIVDYPGTTSSTTWTISYRNTDNATTMTVGSLGQTDVGSTLQIAEMMG